MATHDAQNGNGGNTDSDPEQGAVEQLIKILNALYSATEALKPYASSDKQVPESINDSLRDARNELVLWCEGHLKNNLKAIMLRAFGPQIAKEGSLRFTVLWNDVLFKMLSSGRLKAPEGDVIKAYQSTLSIKIWESATQYLQLFGKNKDNVPKKIPEMNTRDWSKQSRKELYETIMDGTITKNDFINGIQNLVVSPFSQDLFLFIKIYSELHNKLSNKRKRESPDSSSSWCCRTGSD
jgi:hypothetical protein